MARAAPVIPLGGNILRVRWLAVLTCLLGAFAFGVAACGDDDDDGGDGGGGATVSGDTMKGTVKFGDMGEGTFTGKRK